MFHALLEGLFLGFTLSFLVGPAFFLLLEVSLRDGVKHALFFDLGVLISDIFFIYIAFSFTQEVESLQKNQHTFEILIGIIFILFGLYNISRKRSSDLPVEVENVHLSKFKWKYVRMFLKGFIFNIINPAVLFYWFAVTFVGQYKNNFGENQMLVFYASILFAFFSIDVLKIIGASSLKKFTTPDILRKVNQIVGFILIVFGIALIIKGSFHNYL
jgi:threonine/homoserine/homoserine lactone efflux protein